MIVDRESWSSAASRAVARRPPSFAKVGLLGAGIGSFVLLACPAGLTAQTSLPREAPAEYEEALALLAAGDTVAAIEGFRRATSAAPRYGPAYLRLGALLSAVATEVEREYGGRRDAQKALESAYKLMGDDPEVLLEYGLLLRKQGMRVDAKRVLDRAWQTAERRGIALPPEQAARLHFQLGRIYETWWEDWQNMIYEPSMAWLGTCSALPGPAEVADHAVACPERVAEGLSDLVPLAHMKSEERARMVEHFRAAFEADPSHVDAAVHLLGHLADAGAWEEYDDVARRLLLVVPDDPRANLFRGLGLHERGRSVAAEPYFLRAVERLPAEERRVFEDVSLLLPPGDRARYASLDEADQREVSRFVLAGKDPLFLTSVNERRLEHYARMAWAELKFGAPRSELRGWESDRGRIWVRYGMPWRWFQTGYGSGGRTIYWLYGAEGPVFTFTRRLTYRRARFTEAAAVLAERLESERPEAYQLRTVTAIHPIAEQPVRFRDSKQGTTRVEVHAELPLDSLGAEPGQPIETGIFIFDRNLDPLWEKRESVAAGARSGVVAYVWEAPAGRYLYGVEARTEGPDSVPRPAARARAWIETSAFPPGELSVSDLLVAKVVEPRVPEPGERRDFHVVANPSLTFAPEEPVSVYFEIYNLLPDADQHASYELELVVTVEKIERTGTALAKVLGELADLWGFTPEGTEAVQLRFHREARVVARDMIPEYFRIQLPTTPAGRYGLRLRVFDRNAGSTAVTERTFWFREP